MAVMLLHDFLQVQPQMSFQFSSLALFPHNDKLCRSRSVFQNDFFFPSKENGAKDVVVSADTSSLTHLHDKAHYRGRICAALLM